MRNNRNFPGGEREREREEEERES
jgi:hypothetical protein